MGWWLRAGTVKVVGEVEIDAAVELVCGDFEGAEKVGFGELADFQRE